MNRMVLNIPFATFLGFNGDKEPESRLSFAEYQPIAHKFVGEIFIEVIFKESWNSLLIIAEQL